MTLDDLTGQGYWLFFPNFSNNSEIRFKNQQSIDTLGLILERNIDPDWFCLLVVICVCVCVIERRFGKKLLLND